MFFLVDVPASDAEVHIPIFCGIQNLKKISRKLHPGGVVVTRFGDFLGKLLTGGI